MNYLRALSASLLTLSLLGAPAAVTLADTDTDRAGNAGGVDGRAPVAADRQGYRNASSSVRLPVVAGEQQVSPSTAAALDTVDSAETARRAAAYLGTQVRDGHVEGDVELTAWVTLALLAVGGHGDTVEATTDWLAGQASRPALSTADRAAVVLVVTALGRDPRSVAGVDLVAAVRADAADDGRCSTANVAVGSALCALALQRAGEPVPGVILDTLLSLADPLDASLMHEGQPDVWSSAVGLQALAALDGKAGARGAGLGVRDFLAVRSDLDGPFDGTAPVVVNALVAQGLLAVSEDVASHLAWLSSMQLANGAMVSAYDTLQADTMATAMATLALTGHGLGTVGLADPGTDYGPHPHVRRTTGANRYEVAANIATAWDRAPTVVVASGENFPDAIPGSALAAHEGGPILLTRQGSLPGATMTALRRLKPRDIFIMGSEGAVSSAVEEALQGYVNGGSVLRIPGDNRYVVAMNAAYHFQSAPVPRAYLATGLDWPDGLTGGAVAGREGAPVVLTRKDSVPAVVLNNLRYLGVKEVVILGGTSAISSNAETQLKAAGYTTRRVSGSDRYAVAANVSRDGLPGPHAFVATGLNWPDALAAGPLAAAVDAPLLLTRPSTVPGATANRIVEEQAAVVSVFGGPMAVGPTAATGLRLLETNSPYKP